MIKPFTHFQTGTEYVNAAVTMSVEFDKDSDYFRFAQPVPLRKIKLSLPEGKRLSPLIRKGSSVRIDVMGGYLITGTLTRRRLNVAWIEGQITKVGP